LAKIIGRGAGKPSRQAHRDWRRSRSVSGLSAQQTFANLDSIWCNIVIQARQKDLPMSDQYWLTKAQLKRIESFSASQAPVARNSARLCIDSAIRSRTCSQSKKTGGVSQCATTAALAHPSALFASRQSLSFGSVNESW